MLLGILGVQRSYKAILNALLNRPFKEWKYFSDLDATFKKFFFRLKRICIQTVLQLFVGKFRRGFTSFMMINIEIASFKPSELRYAFWYCTLSQNRLIHTGFGCTFSLMKLVANNVANKCFFTCHLPLGHRSRSLTVPPAFDSHLFLWICQGHA